MRIKKLKILLVLSIILTLPVIFTACDTGECFDNGKYQSQPTMKATPSSKPINDTDC